MAKAKRLTTGSRSWDGLTPPTHGPISRCAKCGKAYYTQRFFERNMTCPTPGCRGVEADMFPATGPASDTPEP